MQHRKTDDASTAFYYKIQRYKIQKNLNRSPAEITENAAQKPATVGRFPEKQQRATRAPESNFITSPLVI